MHPISLGKTIILIMSMFCLELVLNHLKWKIWQILIEVYLKHSFIRNSGNIGRNPSQILPYGKLHRYYIQSSNYINSQFSQKISVHSVQFNLSINFSTISELVMTIRFGISSITINKYKQQFNELITNYTIYIFNNFGNNQ